MRWDQLAATASNQPALVAADGKNTSGHHEKINTSLVDAAQAFVLSYGKKNTGGASMCTAATYQTKYFYFGRNLDYEFPYGEEVCIVPRKFPLPFRHLPEAKRHLAMIGMAHVEGGYPLFYDAVNETGLCAAGLNFVGNAAYAELSGEKTNVAQFEFLPWLLGSCRDLREARRAIAGMNLVGTPFSAKLPTAQLHWLIADKTGAIVLESTADGLHVYENPVGVLTNNPPFPMQLFALNNYVQLSPRPPVNRFSSELSLKEYSRGMGAIGLPGDLSSQSRFIRAAFTRLNAKSGDTEEASVSQFFHILTAVEQTRGCCELENGKYEITLYSSCCNADTGVYYYTTYENRQITAVSLFAEDLEASGLVRFALGQKQEIRYLNGKNA